MSLLFRKLFGCLTLDDLPKGTPDIRKLREKTKILLIDDQVFQYEASLRSSGFNIKVEKEWHDINEVINYSIVVSDNKGVAKNMGQQTGGLYMLREAKKMFPEKVYILYSATFIDIRENDTKGLITISKSDKPDDWSDILDDSIIKLHSFRENWEKTRTILLEKGVSEKDLRKIQHIYVKSIIKKKELDTLKSDMRLDIDTVSLIVRIMNLAVSAAKLITFS